MLRNSPAPFTGAPASRVFARFLATECERATEIMSKIALCTSTEYWRANLTLLKRAQRTLFRLICIINPLPPVIVIQLNAVKAR